ncbi:MAG: hypothetical protein AAFN40_12540 [Cyanobacteria bacterium J06560_6]
MSLTEDRSYCQLSVEISAETARSETIAQLKARTDGDRKGLGCG